MKTVKKFPEGKSYPIDEVLPRIKEPVLASPSVVLQAPPGSGKTTRTPLALLELIPPEKGRILMLEPRRNKPDHRGGEGGDRQRPYPKASA
jgi:HrpA-like RNA helicase